MNLSANELRALRFERTNAFYQPRNQMAAMGGPHSNWPTLHGDPDEARKCIRQIRKWLREMEAALPAIEEILDMEEA